MPPVTHATAKFLTAIVLVPGELGCPQMVRLRRRRLTPGSSPSPSGRSAASSPSGASGGRSGRGGRGWVSGGWPLRPASWRTSAPAAPTSWIPSELRRRIRPGDRAPSGTSTVLVALTCNHDADQRSQARDHPGARPLQRRYGICRCAGRGADEADRRAHRAPEDPQAGPCVPAGSAQDGGTAARLLEYIKREDIERYRALIAKLGLRR